MTKLPLTASPVASGSEPASLVSTFEVAQFAQSDVSRIVKAEAVSMMAYISFGVSLAVILTVYVVLISFAMGMAVSEILAAANPNH